VSCALCDSQKAIVKQLHWCGQSYFVLWRNVWQAELFSAWWTAPAFVNSYVKFEAFLVNKCTKIFWGDQPCQCSVENKHCFTVCRQLEIMWNGHVFLLCPVNTNRAVSVRAVSTFSQSRNYTSHFLHSVMVRQLALSVSMSSARISSKEGSYFMGRGEQPENMLWSLLLSSLKPF
jgi:hypothetical protein